jgi:hypothetical protein
MARERTILLMEMFILEITKTESLMGMEGTLGQMGVIMKGSLRKD